MKNSSENVDGISERNFDCESTEPYQISDEIEVISHTIVKQNNTKTKITQIEKQLNNKMLNEIRVNKRYNVSSQAPNFAHKPHVHCLYMMQVMMFGDLKYEVKSIS